MFPRSNNSVKLQNRGQYVYVIVYIIIVRPCHIDKLERSTSERLEQFNSTEMEGGCGLSGFDLQSY